MIACQVKRVEPVLIRENRNEVILEHMPQVRLIACQLHRRLPPSVPLDDLISAGIMGLLSAIDRYNGDLGVKLKTYAEYKIRGAILDSLRMLDWLPRVQRARTKRVGRAVSELSQRNGQMPGEGEVASHLGIPLERYQQMLSKLDRFEDLTSVADKRQLLLLTASTERYSPSEIFARSELRKTLESAISRLPNIESRVVILVFFEGMALRDVAKTLGLHESRISQIKAQATARLRFYLTKSRTGGRSETFAA